jgi:hypothetical protein
LKILPLLMKMKQISAGTEWAIAEISNCSLIVLLVPLKEYFNIDFLWTFVVVWLEITWLDHLYWNVYLLIITWTSNKPVVTFIERHASGDKVCGIFFQHNGVLPHFGCQVNSLLESVLQKLLDWSSWSSTLAVKISGPNPAWFPSVGSNERADLQN